MSKVKTSELEVEDCFPKNYTIHYVQKCWHSPVFLPFRGFSKCQFVMTVSGDHFIILPILWQYCLQCYQSELSQVERYHAVETQLFLGEDASVIKGMYDFFLPYRNIADVLSCFSDSPPPSPTFPEGGNPVLYGEEDNKVRRTDG